MFVVYRVGRPGYPTPVFRFGLTLTFLSLKEQQIISLVFTARFFVYTKSGTSKLGFYYTFSGKLGEQIFPVNTVFR